MIKSSIRLFIFGFLAIIFGIISSYWGKSKGSFGLAGFILGIVAIASLILGILAVVTYRAWLEERGKKRKRKK